MLTPDEQERLLIDTDEGVKKIMRWVNGDQDIKTKGLLQRVNEMEDAFAKHDLKMKKIIWIISGVGIGTIIASAIFGYLSWRELSDVLKAVK